MTSYQIKETACFMHIYRCSNAEDHCTCFFILETGGSIKSNIFIDLEVKRSLVIRVAFYAQKKYKANKSSSKNLTITSRHKRNF